MEKIRAITADTFIPLSILSVLVGGVVWLTVLNETVSASSTDIVLIKNSQAEYMKNVQEIRERLIRIEETLKNGQKR